MLIGAIVSKSVILKLDLHQKDEKLTDLSKTLKSKELTLSELSERLAKSQASLLENERVLKLKLDEIAKLNKLLLEANTKQGQLSDKIVIIQDQLDKNKKSLIDFCTIHSPL